MGKVHKIGDEYYIEFYARGLLYQQKAGMDKSVAEEMLRSVEDKIQKGEMQTIVRDVDIDVFFKTFLEKQSPTYPPKTIERFEDLIKHFAQFLKVNVSTLQKLSQITPTVIDQYHIYCKENEGGDAESFKRHTVALSLLMLEEIFNFGIKLGYINDNSTLHVKHRLPTVIAGNVIDDHLKEKIADLPDRQMSDIFIFLIETGLQLKELICLQWHYIDINDRTICLSSEQPYEGRTIPLTHLVIKILEIKNAQRKSNDDYVFMKGGNMPYAEEDILKLLDQLNLHLNCSPNLKISDFRMAFAKQILAKGVSMFQLCTYLGFDDIVHIIPYTHLLSRTKFH